MGLLGFNFDEGFDSLQERLRNTFKGPISKQAMRDALSRNDFAGGMEIVELHNGAVGPRGLAERILLVGDLMPHQPFTYGGEQKIIKDYYPGNSEPTVQVLGPREKDVTIKGRFKSKKLPDRTPPPGFIGPSQPDLRPFAQEMQQLITAMRIRGNVVRITMGEWQRFGFIESEEFNMKTIADINYSINFSIIGFNPPSDCKVLVGTRTVPTDINKSLIAEVTALQAAADVLPDDIKRSFGDQIKDAVSQVATVVSQVTDFVDTVLDEVDDVKSALFRAQGLIKHARNTVSTQAGRLGGLFALNGVESSANIPPGAGIRSSYAAASKISFTISSMFSMMGFLAALQTQLSFLRETEPLARHRVVSGDNLQRIANKFYGESEQWTEIYDHNKLETTELEVGSILEIPRVDQSE